MMQPYEVAVLGAEGMFGRMASVFLAGSRRLLALSRDDLAADWHVTALRAALAPAASGLIVNGIGMLAGNLASLEGAELAKALQVNAAFPHRLAEAAAELNCRVLHISTDAVFSPSHGNAVETDTPDPTDDYGRSKLAGEVDAGHVLNLRCSIIGPAPQRRLGLWEWLVNQPVGTRISGYADQAWAGCTTLQLSEACLALQDGAAFSAMRQQGGILHVAPNPALTKFDLLRQLSAVLRPDIEVVSTVSGKPVTRVLASIRSYTWPTISAPDWPTAITQTAAFASSAFKRDN